MNAGAFGLLAASRNARYRRWEMVSPTATVITDSAFPTVFPPIPLSVPAVRVTAVGSSENDAGGGSVWSGSGAAVRDCILPLSGRQLVICGAGNNSMLRIGTIDRPNAGPATAADKNPNATADYEFCIALQYGYYSAPTPMGGSGWLYYRNVAMVSCTGSSTVDPPPTRRCLGGIMQGGFGGKGASWNVPSAITPGVSYRTSAASAVLGCIPSHLFGGVSVAQGPSPGVGANATAGYPVYIPWYVKLEWYE